MPTPKPPDPKPPQWLVDYYQLNASISHKGDAAIAALIRRDGDTAKLTVQCLVLIDGGNGIETAALIVTTLGQIKAKYGMTTGPKLDAIILSHWDLDHFKGVLAFLALEANWDTTTKRHTYLKYDGSGVGTTTLYCQAFKAGYTDKVYIKGRLKPSTGFTQLDDPFNASVQVKKDDKTSKFWVANVIKVYHHLDVDLRGCNVFTGKFLSTTGIDASNSPLNLVTQNNPWTKTNTNDLQNAPGLYIVG
ncbi:MAG: hypothetical protein Q9182_003896 [Xanthomendoza sp. 2 TL-2023]